MKTLGNLLLYCDNLKSILDIDGWTNINKVDLDELKEHMQENNADIILEEDHGDSRGVSLYQICQSALKEMYHRVPNFGE